MAKASIARNGVEITTVLGTGTMLSGTLRFDTSLMIRGRFEGDIESKGDLYIDEGAQVSVGKAKALSIIVAGSVRGDLEAVDKVELRSAAQIHGNVRSAKLRIADGVLFEGRCEMVKNSVAFDPFSTKTEERA
jgi:cytoskeletal protein CcmA (bactofilin family)